MTDMLARPAGADAPEGDARALEAQFTTQHKRCLIRLHGALVQDTLHTFSSMFDRLGRLAFDEVIVDLKGVSELDEAGTKVLVCLQHYVEARRAELVIWCADAAMATSVSAHGIRVAVPLAVTR